MNADNREMAVVGALSDRLIIRRLSGTEQLGRPFEYSLDLLSTDENLVFGDIVGQNLSVRLSLPDGGERFFNGFITRFAQVGHAGRYAAFQAQVRPWLWFLTRCSDCRIFQGQTVPEIVASVFREHGFSNFEDALTGTYSTAEYCVQYRETDFAFVSRLLEHEGIHYFFRHERDKHILVLADDVSAHAVAEGYADIPYYPPGNEAGRERDHIAEWRATQEIQAELYALRDYDFEKPRANLESKSAIPREHAAGSYEIYDYPGDYLTKEQGDRYATIRVQEQQARFESLRGSGNARGIGAGHLFTLQGYPREDQNREYLITSANFELQANDRETGDAAAGTSFSCAFMALDSRQPFRPARLTPKPLIRGPQTATVVGKSGEEIWTDEYGRVKVQFPWDRNGQADENSSCWVRVASLWAGKEWGGVHIPRIKQEVLVEFLEGDPDRPIVTGRVYNADNMPPYQLPASKTRSGIKSRSAKGGSAQNFNEIRFEDKKGEEHVFVHAEKDLNERVKNDHSESVGGNKTTAVGGTRTVVVGKHGDEDPEPGGLMASVDAGIKSVAKWVGGKLGAPPPVKPISKRAVYGDEEIHIHGKQKRTVDDTDVLVFQADSTKLVLGITQSHFIGAKISTVNGVSLSEKLSLETEFARSRSWKSTKDKNYHTAKTHEFVAEQQVAIESQDDSLNLKAGQDIIADAGRHASISAGEDIKLQAKQSVTITQAAKLDVDVGQVKMKYSNLTAQTKGGAKISMVGGSIGVKGTVIKLG